MGEGGVVANDFLTIFFLKVYPNTFIWCYVECLYLVVTKLSATFDVDLLFLPTSEKGSTLKGEGGANSFILEQTYFRDEKSAQESK